MPGPTKTPDKSVLGSLSVTLVTVGAVVIGEAKNSVIVPTACCPLRSGQLPPPPTHMNPTTHGPGAGPWSDTAQLSLAVAVPKAALMSLADGLHPRLVDGPPVVITGGVTSAIHLTVRDIVAVLPQASLAVNVLTCALLHPLEVTGPSAEVIVTAPQASVAVAVPSDPAGSAGLQPRFTSL